MKSTLVLVVLTAAAVAADDVIPFMRTPCENVDENMCTISEVRVTPCNARGNSCRLKRGRDFKLSFDFTPNFSASELLTAAYSDNPATGKEMIFVSVGIANACEHATCPTVPGTPNKLDFNLHIGKLLPKGTFPLRWKLWNKENESQMCCFETTVTLQK